MCFSAQHNFTKDSVGDQIKSELEENHTLTPQGDHTRSWTLNGVSTAWSHFPAQGRAVSTSLSSVWYLLEWSTNLLPHFDARVYQT